VKDAPLLIYQRVAGPTTGDVVGHCLRDGRAPGSVRDACGCLIDWASPCGSVGAGQLLASPLRHPLWGPWPPPPAVVAPPRGHQPGALPNNQAFRVPDAS